MILTSLLSPSVALACGGFFCDPVAPVEQTGEMIVFAVDPVMQQTEMHVQVAYEGPASEFAWVIPVRGQPEVGVGSEVLFEVLQRETGPRYNLSGGATLGTCEGDRRVATAVDVADTDVGGGGIPAPPQDVEVLDRQNVGPYETVTLAADSSIALTGWLGDNGYAIPADVEGALAPYVAAGHSFLALKLAADADVGSLAPLALRYEGMTPAIPIQLTAVAAADDMPLVALVLGPHRAIPTNYLHAELNPWALDWFTGGANYADVVSRAADQAGGQAFVTDYSGPSGHLTERFLSDDLGRLPNRVATGDDLFFILDAIDGLSQLRTSDVRRMLAAELPLPPNEDADDVILCPGCYREVLEQTAVTPQIASLVAARLEAEFVGPLRDISAMFERTTHLTRLTSAISPAEMDLDPQFGFNRDLPQTLRNWHDAELSIDCRIDRNESIAPWVLTLDDGESLWVPGDAELERTGQTRSDHLMGLALPAASRIARLTEFGAGELIYDGTADIAQIVDLNNESLSGSSKSCGCQSGTAGGLAGLFLLLPALLVRPTRKIAE